MQKIEYDLPVFKDGDIADLNEYSNEMAKAIKAQIDKFGDPLIFKGTVETLEELKYLTDVKNGYIYTVISEEKNYIYNGTEWVVYSNNESIQFEPLVVAELPEVGKDKVLYLVPNSKQAENNIYDEYIYVNNNWEIVGSTAIDPENLKDSVPIGAIIEYEGDTVPDGYEEVEDEGELYSTEEARIGTWIDGKPLYRKVLQYTDIPVGSSSKNISDLNIGILTNLRVIGSKENGGTIDYGNYYNSDTDYSRIFCRDSNTLQFRIATTSEATLYTVILEYTKQ